jgi:N,N'-diacetyllegionaminate synthase
VEALEELGVSRYKVGSGDIDNHLLLEAICRTAKPVILSSGMSSFDELDEAMGIFRDRGREIVIMQCTSEYPSPPKRWGLNLIRELKKRYKLPVGLSDHSGTIYPGLAAVALGAALIEVHATFDKGMFGPDASSSLEIDELHTLVQGVKQISQSLLNPIKKDIKGDIGRMRRLFGRSLTASKNIPQGTVLSFEDFEAAKPAGYGIPPSMFYQILGRKLKRSLAKGEFIMEDYIE